MVLLEEDQRRLAELLESLSHEANAELALLLDRSGLYLASTGELADVDPTALASLAAGNVAATEALSRLIGETDFSSLHHEGRSGSLHISQVSDKVVLLIVFAERSSLGLVRLRVQQRTPELLAVVHEVLGRGRAAQADGQPATSALPEITEEDIDALFG
jgi:predicted regulator of Ras-like GTPase activity (Roadblock/LC7/MglB family)